MNLKKRKRRKKRRKNPKKIRKKRKTVLTKRIVQLIFKELKGLHYPFKKHGRQLQA